MINELLKKKKNNQNFQKPNDVQTCLRHPRLHQYTCLNLGYY